MPSPSPCSKASRRSASAPACTSAPPASAACTTSSGRSWTTPSTRRSPATATPSTWSCCADGGVSVTDNGRGFPVDLHPKLKKPGVEVALTVLHAGGKFDGKAYAVSGGLHGVGVSVVNALSTRMVVEIHKSGNVWRQQYIALQARPAGEGRGDRPDRLHGHSSGRTRQIFETIEFDFADDLPPAPGDGLPQPRPDHQPASTSARARRRGRQAARGHLHVRGRHRRLRPPPQRHQDADPQVGDRVRAPRRDEGMAVEIAMQWNESYGESVYTFANTINTHEGGTHEEGFRAALTSIVNRYGADEEVPQGRREALRRGHPRGPRRDHLGEAGQPAVRGPDQDEARQHRHEAASCRRSCNERLADWFERNPAEAKMIITKASQAARARIAAQQARKLARRKSLLESGSMPGKLADCQSTDPRVSRAVHRRGRLGRRLGQAGPRPADPGDPADPRQDPQRREGPDRPGAEEQRGPVADHGAGHRHPRRVRHREAAVPQDRADGRRRRRRPAHPDAAAHPAVPLHAPAGRAGPRLPRGPAAVQDQVEQEGRRRPVRLLRPGARRPDRAAPGEEGRTPSRTTSSGSRVSAR